MGIVKRPTIAGYLLTINPILKAAKLCEYRIFIYFDSWKILKIFSAIALSSALSFAD